MESKDTGDEDAWDQEEDGASSTSDSEPADCSNGPTTGISAGVSAVGNSTTHGGGGAGDAGATSSIKPKRTNRKRSKGGRIAADITKDELAQYFNMPTEEAAARLGIGLTVLKRVCRKHGVTRWPYRKVKSLDRLMLNVQSGVAPGQSNKHLMVSPEEILQHKEKMCKGATLDIDPETRRLQQAYSKFNHKLRKTHKYDLTALPIITGSSSAEGEASQGALVAVSNMAGPRPTETSSQAPGATLTSNAQEVDSSLQTKAIDDGRDAASYLTGHPMDPAPPSFQHHPSHSMRPSGTESMQTASAYHMPDEVKQVHMQMMGQLMPAPLDPSAAPQPGGMMNILHSLPPWATLSTFLTSGAVPEATPDLPNGNSRAWLDMLSSQDGVMPSSLFSTFQTPSIPLLTRLTAAPTPSQDTSTPPPTSNPSIPANSHPNILLQATAPAMHPATHAFALNSTWQMTQGAVFNASLAFLPAHTATGINTGPAVVGVTPFTAATLPINIPIPGMKASSPSFSTAPHSHHQPTSTPLDSTHRQTHGAQTDNPNGGTQSNIATTASSPNANMPTSQGFKGHDNHFSTLSRATGPRKRSVFEKVQQELTTLGSLPTTSIDGGGSIGAAALLQQRAMPSEDTDAPPAKRTAPNPQDVTPELDQQEQQQEPRQQQQHQHVHGAPDQEAGAALLLDRLLPVSMFGGMPSGVHVPSSHSMLAHVMDPPVLLSVNLQSLHSLLPFFHSTEVPTSSPAMVAAVSPASQVHITADQPSFNQFPRESKAVDGPLTPQDGRTAAGAPLLTPLSPFPSLSLPSQGPPPVQSNPVVSPARPNSSESNPAVPTASALPQAEAVAFLQAQAHSMSRLAQNQRLVQLSRPIPSTHMLDMLLGNNTNMSQVSDAQALAVLQLSALEMGWVLESVEMVRISGPISSTVTTMPKTRSIRSRVTSVSGRPPASPAAQPMAINPAAFTGPMGPVPVSSSSQPPAG